MIKDYKLINTRPDWVQMPRRRRVWDTIEPWAIVTGLIVLNALGCWLIGN